MWIKNFFSKSWQVIKGVGKKFQSDDLFSYSAVIAYNTIFSLPAMLIIIIKIAGTFFGDEAVTGRLFYQIKGLVGAESAKMIQDVLQNAQQSGDNIWATIIVIATLIFSATTVFIAIQTSLNYIWEVKPKPEKGWLKLIINRLLSFAMIGSLGFLMLVSLVVDALLLILREFITEVFSGFASYLMVIINFAISFGVITVIFAMIFKVLPDAKIRWKNVWVGGIITSALFIVGRLGIGLYLGNSDISSTYGAADSFVVFLVWVYYSSFIMLLGAEFTQVYSRIEGHEILPSEHAVKVIMKEEEHDEGSGTERNPDQKAIDRAAEPKKDDRSKIHRKSRRREL